MINPPTLLRWNSDKAYLAELADMTRRWADWATAVIESWPEDLNAAEPDWASFAAIASLAGPPLPEASPLSASAPRDSGSR